MPSQSPLKDIIQFYFLYESLCFFFVITKKQRNYIFGETVTGWKRSMSPCQYSIISSPSYLAVVTMWPCILNWKKKIQLWKMLNQPQVFWHISIWQVILGNCLKMGRHFQKILARWWDTQCATVYQRPTSTYQITSRGDLPPVEPLGKSKFYRSANNIFHHEHLSVLFFAPFSIKKYSSILT